MIDSVKLHPWENKEKNPITFLLCWLDNWFGQDKSRNILFDKRLIYNHLIS